MKTNLCETKDLGALRDAQREVDRELLRTLESAARLTKLSEDLERRIEKAQERAH